MPASHAAPSAPPQPFPSVATPSSIPGLASGLARSPVSSSVTLPPSQRPVTHHTPARPSPACHVTGSLTSTSTHPAPQPPAQPVQTGPYTPPSPALRALLDAQRAGTPLTRRDVPPDLIVALQAQADRLHAALQPVTELHVAAWLKKLGHLVTNPPGAGQAASQCRAIFEVCGDIPTGAWGPDTRLAWTRQPPRDGYPVGARWPSPNELRTFLLPFANRLQRDAAASRALLASLPAALRGTAF